MRIGMITADWAWQDVLGGSGFHRIGQPAAALKQLGGVEVFVTDGFDLNPHTGIKPHAEMGRNGSGVEDCDVIVFQRWMHKDAARITETAQMAGQIVVQDVDDWYWGLATSNRAFYSAHPKVNPDVNINHYKHALGAADILTVSTPHLAGRLKRFNRHIAVLPNMIDLSRYSPNPVRHHPDRLTVGWTGGIDFRSGDLEQLAGILPQWLAGHDARFVHGGSTPSQSNSAAELLRLPDSVEVEERPMVAPDDYPTLFAGMDIFVAPLADRPFNLAKSNCKLLECSAAGIPYVASHVGPYAEWDGGGRTAKKAAHWFRHLDALADPAERERQREAQLDAVASQDVTVRWADWLMVYDYAGRLRTERLARTMHDLDLLEKELERRGVLADAGS